MNYWRIVGIGGTAFCTAALAALGAGLSEPSLIKVAVFVAILQGLLAAFQEIQKESESQNPLQDIKLSSVFVL